MSVAIVPALYLIVSALGKCNDIAFTAATVQAYRLVPQRLIPAATATLVLTEAALGGALMTGWAPAAIVSIVYMAALSGIALWASRGGDMADCGCLGKSLYLTPAQSALLNAGMIVLTIVALAWPTAAPQPALVLGLGLLLLLVAAATSAYSYRRGAIIDLSAIKQGRDWNPRWLAFMPNPPNPGERDMIVLFLTSECKICQGWLKVMNKAQHLPGALPVFALVGVEAGPPNPLMSALQKSLPLAEIPFRELQKLVSAWPTAAVVRHGRIDEIWRERIPESIVAALRPGLSQAAGGHAGSATHEAFAP